MVVKQIIPTPHVTAKTLRNQPATAHVITVLTLQNQNRDRKWVGRKEKNKQKQHFPLVIRTWLKSSHRMTTQSLHKQFWIWMRFFFFFKKSIVFISVADGGRCFHGEQHSAVCVYVWASSKIVQVEQVFLLFLSVCPELMLNVHLKLLIFSFSFPPLSKIHHNKGRLTHLCG